MPIKVPCLKCKTTFQVPSKLAGTTVRCHACGFMLRLPSPERIQAKKQGAAASGGKADRRSPATGKSTNSPPKTAAEEFDGAQLFEEPFELIETAENLPTGPTGKTSPHAVPEPTVLSCSHCEGLLYYDPNFANQTVACPHCGNHLVMPNL